MADDIPNQQIPVQLRHFAFFMLGQFMIVAGLLLALFGVGRMVGRLLGHDGAGELTVGIACVIIGYALMMHLKPKQIIINEGSGIAQQAEQVKEADAGSYR